MTGPFTRLAQWHVVVGFVTASLVACGGGGGEGTSPAAVDDGGTGEQTDVAANTPTEAEATADEGLIVFQDGPVLSFRTLSGEVVDQIPLEDARQISVSDDGSTAVSIRHAGSVAFSGELQLTDLHEGSVTDLGVVGMAPDLSPDGRQVVYASGDPLAGEEVVISIIEVGGASREVGPSGMWPTWSPDGERVAFIGNDDGVVRIMDADGSNVTELATSDAGPAHSLDWSPDGTRIAFSAGGTDPESSSGISREDVWVIAADGSGLERLTTEDGRGGSSPDWSPDGARIVYVEWHESDETGPEGEESYRPALVVIDAAGGSVEPLDMFGTDPAWIPADR